MWKILLKRMLMTSFAEFGVLLFLLAFWISPHFVMGYAPQAPDFVESLFLFEFLFGHASVGIGIAAMLQGRKGLAVLLIMCFFYGLFFVTLAFSGYFVEIVLYLYLMVSRIYRARTHVQEDKRREIQIAQIGIAFGRVMLLLFTVLPTLAPWPALGLADAGDVFSGSGLMVEEPQRMVVWMVLYFLIVGHLDRLVEKLVIKLGAPNNL